MSQNVSSIILPKGAVLSLLGNGHTQSLSNMFWVTLSDQNLFNISCLRLSISILSHSLPSGSLRFSLYVSILNHNCCGSMSFQIVHLSFT